MRARRRESTAKYGASSRSRRRRCERDPSKGARRFESTHRPSAKRNGPRLREAPSLSAMPRRSGRFVEVLVVHHRARILALGADVAVDELDDRHRRGVRGADTGLDDAGVATVAVGVARGQHGELLHQLRVGEQARVRQATVGQATLLGERDQLLDVGTQFLRLGGGGGDLLVHDQRGRHVAEQGRTVGRGTLQLTAAYAMTHGNFLLVRSGAVSGTRDQVATGTTHFTSSRRKPGPVLPRWPDAAKPRRRTGLARRPGQTLTRT